MRKRIIAMLLMCILVCTLAGCEDANSGSSNGEIITLPSYEQNDEQGADNSNGMQFLKTRNVEEYLAFLESFDYSNYKILGISTCMNTGIYTNNDYYIITYNKLKEPREAKKTGKVSLFRTRRYEEFNNFINNLDDSKYEILDISTCMNTGVYTSNEYYIVTYIEIKN